MLVSDTIRRPRDSAKPYHGECGENTHATGGEPLYECCKHLMAAFALYRDAAKISQAGGRT